MTSNEIKGIQLSQAVEWSGQDIFEVALLPLRMPTTTVSTRYFMPHGMSSRRSTTMAKKLENMTQDERIAYWAAQREKERIQRRDRIAKLSLDQRVAVIKVYELLDEILDTAMYPDLGGIKAVTAYDLQELSDAKDRLRHEFNFDVREHG
jgi:hypothetical protein